MASNTLIAFAILKVNYDRRGNDYISNFVPFVGEVLRTAESDYVSLGDVQTGIKEDFGLIIPRDALKTILGRAVRNGYATKSYGVYVRNSAFLEEKVRLAPIREDVNRQYNAVLSRAIDFTKRQGHEIESTELDAALVRLLARRSVPILELLVDGQPLVPSSEAASSDHTIDVLLDAFLVDAVKSDPETIGFLETLARGSMLAAAMYLPNPNDVSRSLAGLVVYLDTTLILRVLGASGPEFEAAATELLSLLQELGANICCFTHNVQEVYGILHSATIALKSPRRAEESYGEVSRYLITAGKTSSDVEETIADLEERLKKLRIQVLEKPSHARPISVDEVALEQVLADFVRYRRREALLKDLDSLTAIYRLRGGKSKLRLENSVALLVTTNRNLSRASDAFFKSELAPGNFPLTLTAQTVTTLAWLKKPTTAPDLPLRQVIADCYAALSPDDGLWVAYLERIKELRERKEINEAMYLQLRFSLEARLLLMTRTGDELSGFTEGTVTEIIGRFNEQLVGEADSRTGAAQEARRQAEMAVAAAEERTRAVERERVREIGVVEQRLRHIADRVALTVTILSFAIVSVALVWLATIAVIRPLAKSENASISWSVFVAVIAYLGISIAGQLFGWTVWALVSRIRSPLQTWLEERLRKYFVVHPRL